MTGPAFYRLGRRLAVGSIAVAIACCGAAAAGVRYVATPSIPMGLYWSTGGTPHRGDYVIFCPPVGRLIRLAVARGYLEPGSCPVGSYPMAKRMVAVAGDRVEISPGGVRVNGSVVPNSRPFTHDISRRALPSLTMTRVLPTDEIVTMGDTAISFDSRYFGPVQRQQIIGRLVPIAVW